jgi:hypothetical protein
MRSFGYARTPPGARLGPAVFAVRLVFVIMVRELNRGSGAASTAFREKVAVGQKIEKLP